MPRLSHLQHLQGILDDGVVAAVDCHQGSSTCCCDCLSTFVDYDDVDCGEIDVADATDDDDADVDDVVDVGDGVVDVVADAAAVVVDGVVVADDIAGDDGIEGTSLRPPLVVVVAAPYLCLCS
jgi:hypothetical protein